MKIIQVRDLIRYKTITIPAPEKTLAFKEKLLLKGKKEKIVAELVGLERDLPGAKIEAEFIFDRVLTPQEISEFSDQQTGELDRLRQIQDEANKLKLKMHFFSSSIGWQGKVVSFLFTSDNPIDFRDLLKAMAKHIPNRIHLQRVDARERADIVGDVNSCGRPEAGAFAFNKQKISLNAVRDQGIMIRGNDKIYDVSGKLKRDLMYEVDLYKEYRKYLPHLKQEVSVAGKKARVVGLDILNQRVKVHFFDTDVTDVFPVAEVDYPNKQTFTAKDFELECPTIDIESPGLPV